MQEIVPFQYEPTRVSNVCDVDIGAAIDELRDVRQGRRSPHLHSWPGGPKFQRPVMHRQATFCKPSCVPSVGIAAVSRK